MSYLPPHLSVPLCSTGRRCCGNSTTNISRRAYVTYQMPMRYGNTFPAIRQHIQASVLLKLYDTYSRVLPSELSSQRLHLSQRVSNNQSWPAAAQQSSHCLWIRVWLARSTLNMYSLFYLCELFSALFRGQRGIRCPSHIQLNFRLIWLKTTPTDSVKVVLWQHGLFICSLQHCRGVSMEMKTGSTETIT